MIIFAFINLLVAISSVQTSLTPISEPLSKAFQVPVIEVTMTSIIFSITYIPVTFVAIKMFQEMKLTTVFRTACAIVVVGAWIRTSSADNQNFGWILTGYTVISLAYPILLSAITLICNRWLADSERTFITQLCGLSIPIGAISSFVITGLVFSNPNALVEETHQLIFIQNIWITSFALLLFVVIKERP